VRAISDALSAVPVVGGAPTGSLVPPDKLTPIGRGPKDRG
jgi:hypothetical protein